MLSSASRTKNLDIVERNGCGLFYFAERKSYAFPGISNKNSGGYAAIKKGGIAARSLGGFRKSTAFPLGECGKPQFTPHVSHAPVN